VKTLRISQKLIISLIIISLLPYAAISYINYSAEKNAIEIKIFDELSALAEAKNTHISTVVNFRIEQIREIATSNFMQEIESRNTSDLNFNLERVKREIPVFFELSALDKNGKVVASTESSLINTSHMEEEFFKKAKENLYIGGINYYDNRTGYIISSPVFNRSTGKLLGVVAVTIYPRLVYDVTGDYTGLGESGETLIVQKRGDEVVFLNPLRHNKSAALHLMYPIDSNIALPAIYAVKGEKGASRALDYRGVDVFSAYTYVPIVDWGLVVKIDSSEALIPATRSKERYIALGIFYFVVVGAVAYLIGRRFTGPLVRLSNASKKITEGNLTVRIEPESRDEIGELAGSFNIMVQRLKEVYEGLDQNVKERTRDLNKRNLELAALIKTNQSISSGLDLNKVLEIAVREAVRIVNVSYCSIILVEEGKGYGRVASEHNPRDHVKPSLGEILYFNDFPILNEAYQKRHYVLVTDTSKAKLSPEEKEMARRLKIGSILVVPLILGEKTLGAMQLSSLSEVKEFTDEEIDICQTIANQAAIAIENAHLYSELKRHDRTIETLFEIDRVVSQTLELESIFKDALTKAMEVTETEAGGIYLLEENGETLSLKAHIGLSPELVDALSKIKVGQGVSGMAVSSGKPLTLDIEKYPSPELLSPLIKDGIVSLASTPLIAKGKVVGAMSLAYKRHRAFSRDDLDLLASIGSQIGVAIQNATLFSELEKHHKMLKTLYAIESVVSRSLDLEEIFNVALSKTLEVTDTEAGTLYSLDGEILRLKAIKGLSSEFEEKALIRKIGDGIPGISAQSKKPITLDISQYSSPLLLPYVTKEGLVSFIGTPLLSKGKVVGALALGTKKKRIFMQDDLDLLFSIGNVIGIAVENASLYRESKDNLQKLQKAYEELQTLDRMKSEFLSNVSHELKTPLVSIRGYGELMYDGKVGSLTEAQKKALEAIIRNTDRLTRLIDSILFLSLQQMGKPEIKMKARPLSIDEIITASFADMNVQAEKKNLYLNKNVPANLKVMGDRDRLTEVFLNLIDNAIKFTSSGGIDIRAMEEENNVHVTVTDTGIGIPENVIPYLFQRFYQADASLTRKYGGTGLGLYICKNIIDAHKGEIRIESEVGKGTTVHILLPSAKEVIN